MIHRKRRLASIQRVTPRRHCPVYKPTRSLVTTLMRRRARAVLVGVIAILDVSIGNAAIPVMTVDVAVAVAVEVLGVALFDVVWRGRVVVEHRHG